MNNNGNGNINNSTNKGCLTGFGIYGALFLAMIVVVLVVKIFSLDESVGGGIIFAIIALAVLVTIIKIALKIKQMIDNYKRKQEAIMLAKRQKAAEELKEHSKKILERAYTLSNAVDYYDKQTSHKSFKKQKEVWEVLDRAYLANSELKEFVKDIKE